MKKKHMMLGLAMMATALTMQSFIANDDTMTKENGMFVINTTSLATNASINSAKVGQEVSMATILTMLGISKGAAKIIGTLGWWGIPLVAVISSLLLGLLSSALSTAGSESAATSSSTSTSTPKTKLVSDPIKAFGTYDVKCKLGYEISGIVKVTVKPEE